MKPSEYLVAFAVLISMLISIACWLASAGQSFAAARNRRFGVDRAAAYWAIHWFVPTARAQELFTDDGWKSMLVARRLSKQSLFFMLASIAFGLIALLLRSRGL